MGSGLLCGVGFSAAGRVVGTDKGVVNAEVEAGSGVTTEATAVGWSTGCGVSGGTGIAGF